MLKRKIIDYRITEKDGSLFVCVGNLFPDVRPMLAIHDKFTTNFKDIVVKLIKSPSSFYMKYISSRKRLKLSSYMCSILDIHSYGGVLGIYEETGAYPRQYYSLVNGGINLTANQIELKFGDKWAELYDTYHYVYDAIRPYDITLKENNTHKHGGTTKEISNSSGEDTNDNKYLVNVDKTNTNVYGFNSNEPVPQSVVENRSDSTDSLVNNYSNNRNQTITHGRTIEHTRNYTRLGNIGNKTQQELIVEQRRLLNDIVVPTLYEDLDSVFCSHRFVDL